MVRPEGNHRQAGKSKGLPSGKWPRVDWVYRTDVQYCDLTVRGKIIELGPEVRKQNAHRPEGPKLIRQRGCPGWTEVHLGLSVVGHTGIRAGLGSLYSLLETRT